MRRLALSTALVAGAILPGIAPQAACAAGSSAALVVDTGSSVLRYCVNLGGKSSVTGIELIKLAGNQHGLSYGLGYGGQAVCMLAGIGSNANDCLEKDKPYFWGYWRGAGGGGWSWSSSGAGSTSVGPGDVEGWAWGTGNNGSSHPQPPNTDYDEVCESSPGGGGGNGGGGGGGNGEGRDEDGSSDGEGDQPNDDRNPSAGDAESRKNGQEKSGSRDETSTGGAASSDRSREAGDAKSGGSRGLESGTGSAGSSEASNASPAVLASGASPQAGNDRAPLGLLFALILIAALTTAGFAINHRRHAGGGSGPGG